MATFVRIVDAGSLSAAAGQTGRSVASVVRTLAALEAHLGTRLLNRTTRRLALTDEGAEFLEWSRRILAEFDAVEHRFDARRQGSGGLLRLTAPVELGRRHVAPLVAAFLRQHPAMRVDLLLLDRVVDLLEEGLDLAIRIGHLPDSSMVAKTVGRTRQVVCASPDFLQGTGPVAHPSDLQALDCIAFLPQDRHWHFQVGDDSVAAAISARVATNQVQLNCDMCLQGLGVARLLHYQAADALADGRLVRLLRPFEPPDIPIQMVYPHSRLLSARVRRFIDWAAPRLEAALPDPG
ncbi:LysR family transcriptional regulator [Niveispirillum fermenti]|uniref:LysR family transcriptional regulator n=1 Tax=Niveispirillum fermenti TaxID=1233113 RepID=UPI003A8AF931